MGFRLFDEMNYLVCWEVTDDDIEKMQELSIAVEELSGPSAFETAPAHIACCTHRLLISANTRPLYVIDLKRIVSNLGWHNHKKGIYLMEISDIVLEKIREYVHTAMEGNDPSHDYAHIKRVVGLTKKICRSHREANTQLAQAVALLHEMRDDKLFLQEQEDELRHFLASLSLPPEACRLIFESIGQISFRKKPLLGEDALPEVKIVQDADRLDAIGAMGVARAFAYGGAKGYPFYTAGGEQGGILQHFDQKLFRLYELLNTEEAKIMAEARNEFMKEFYINFYRELGEAEDGAL